MTFDRLQAMRVFTRVVDTGNFTRAALALDCPKAAVTKFVQALEAHLRTKLLNRTTRRVSVTPDGAAYYERASRLLAELDALEADVAGAQAVPAGRLRVDVGSSIGARVIIPALAAFHARHPGLRIDLGVSDRPVDLIAENVDCAVRAGTIHDTSLVARRIGELRFATVAAPAYLARHGVPRHPAQLDAEPHAVVGWFAARTGKQVPLDFTREGERLEIEGRCVLAVDDSGAYVDAGLAGLGVIQAPTCVLQQHLARGALVPVLAEWQADTLPVHVVYTPNRHPGAKLRVFVDWVAEVFAGNELTRRALQPDGTAAPRAQATASAGASARGAQASLRVPRRAGGVAPLRPPLPAHRPAAA